MTKRRVTLIVSIAAGTLVFCVLVVGAIAGTVFYFIGHSRAADAARAFLRQSRELRADIGEVKDFGWLVTGNLRSFGAQGNAVLSLKVMGARRTTRARVWLVYRGGDDWRVAGASYETETGRTLSLFDPYAAASAEETSEMEIDTEDRDEGETGEAEQDDEPSEVARPSAERK